MIFWESIYQRDFRFILVGTYNFNFLSSLSKFTLVIIHQFQSLQLSRRCLSVCFSANDCPDTVGAATHFLVSGFCARGSTLVSRCNWWSLVRTFLVSGCCAKVSTLAGRCNWWSLVRIFLVSGCCARVSTLASRCNWWPLASTYHCCVVLNEGKHYIFVLQGF